MNQLIELLRGDGKVLVDFSPRLIAAVMGAWSNWGILLSFIYLWFSLLSVALITVRLVIFGPCTASANAQRIESVV